MSEIMGRVVRAFGGLYSVQLDTGDIFECKARGRIKLKYDKILVGDRVRISRKQDGTAVLEEILDRSVVLQRPHVANISQVVVVAAVAQPVPDFLLLDRLLVIAAASNLKQVICFNKIDLDCNGDVEEIYRMYKDVGYNVVKTSARVEQGIEELRQFLRGEISVFTGQSGVGKSALINALNPECSREVGEISKRLGRGKHTTRASELLSVDKDTFIVDTPGFTSLTLDMLDKRALVAYFPEIARHAQGCRFLDCLHREEPDCEVKQHLLSGDICEERYNNYISLLEEIEEAMLRRY
jgi:ribosome biogenesis GTPase